MASRSVKLSRGESSGTNPDTVALAPRSSLQLYDGRGILLYVRRQFWRTVNSALRNRPPPPAIRVQGTAR